MNNVMKRTTLALTLLAAIATTPAGANIRRFTYTYESAVLPPGHTELEPWITWRAGVTGSTPGLTTGWNTSEGSPTGS